MHRRLTRQEHQRLALQSQLHGDHRGPPRPTSPSPAPRSPPAPLRAHRRSGAAVKYGATATSAARTAGRRSRRGIICVITSARTLTCANTCASTVRLHSTTRAGCIGTAGRRVHAMYSAMRMAGPGRIRRKGVKARYQLLGSVPTFRESGSILDFSSQCTTPILDGRPGELQVSRQLDAVSRYVADWTGICMYYIGLGPGP